MLKFLKMLTNLFILFPIGIFVTLLMEWCNRDKKKVKTWLVLFSIPFLSLFTVPLLMYDIATNLDERRYFRNDVPPYDKIFQDGYNLLIFLIKFILIPLIAPYYVSERWMYLYKRDKHVMGLDDKIIGILVYPIVIMIYVCFGYFMCIFAWFNNKNEMMDVFEQRKPFFE